MIRFLLICSLFTPALVGADELKPFTSDGCSAFPNGSFDHNELWLECCHAHDSSYWRGGNYNERVEADKDLEACVRQVGEPEIALLMLAGVRVGGTPFLPTSFRWGYGWNYPRFYGALTQNEVLQVKNFTKASSVEPKTPVSTGF